jgi:hypothetical protein
MPVGRIEYCWIGPMTFFESLEATGKTNLIGYFNDHDISNPVSEAVHGKMISLLRDYFLTGDIA